MAVVSILGQTGGGATCQSGTAVYASMEAGMSISDVEKIPEMIVFYITFGGGTPSPGAAGYGVCCILADWNESDYTQKIGWDFCDGYLVILTPTFVSFSNGTLTVKSNGGRAVYGSTWNYKLVY